MAADLDIVDFLAELRREYGDGPSYPMLYRLLVNGVVPGHRYRNRWRLPPESKAVVAEKCGLTKRAQPTDAAA